MRLLPRLLLQLVAPFLVVAAIILLLIGNLIENGLRTATMRIADINLGLRSQIISQQLVTHRRILRLLADVDFARAGSLPQTLEHLGRWQKSLPEAEDMLFFTPDGKAYSSNQQVYDIHDRDYFSHIQRGEYVLSSVLISRVSGNPVILLAEPVRDGKGNPAGAIGITLTVSDIAHWVRDMDVFAGGIPLLVDSGANVLVGHPQEQISPGAPPDPAKAPVTAEIQRVFKGQVGTTRHAEWTVLSRPISDTPWKIAVAFPEEVIFGLIHRARAVGGWIIAFLTLGSVFLVYLLNRSLLQPIHRLADAQQKLEQGQFTRLDSDRSDELGQLSRSFDKMAVRLDAALRNARETEHKYRALFENSTDAIVLIEDGRFIDCNPVTCELFACSRDEVLAHGPLDFSPPLQPDGRDSASVFSAHIEAALAGDEQFLLWQHVARNGRLFVCEISIKCVEVEGRKLTFSVIRDISAREKAANLAREMEAKFRRIFSTGVDYMIVARLRDGLIVEANEGFERLTGHAIADAVGKTTLELDLWQDPQQRESLVKELEAHGRVQSFPMLLRRRDGELREINASVATFDLEGEAHYVSIARDVTEERKLQRDLAASEARLQTIIATTPTPVCINRLSDLAFISVNPAWETLYGMSTSDMIGKTLKQTGFIATNPKQLKQQTRQLLENGHIESQEAEFITPDGRRVSVIYSSRVIELDGQRVMISISADISRLKEVEKRLKVIVESAPAVIVINRLADLTYHDVNPEFERLFECSRQQVVGKTIKQAGFTIANPVSFREQTVRLLADGRIDNVQAEFITAAGKHVSVIYSSRIIDLDGEPVMLSMAADISHIKEVEAGLRQAKIALQESEQRFIVLFQSSPIALSVSLLASESFRLGELNGAWYRSFGYAADEALGKSPVELGLWPDPEEHADFYQQIEKTGEVHEYDVWLKRKDGSAVLCAMSAQRIAVGRQTLLLTAYVDITEKRRIEQEIRDLNTSLETRIQQRTFELQRAQAELMRSEKLAALGSLVAGVAHELNTPIGTSLTVASTLAERTRDINSLLQAGMRRSALETYLADARSGADILARNLQRAAELIQSFKSIAVDQASDQRRDFDLHQIVDETLVALRPSLKKKPYVVHNEVEQGLSMNSYAGSLEQVIVNLINNSILHGFDGRDHGTVTIRGRRHGDDAILLSVRDDGCGISPANLSRVFDPFFTTKLGRGGSGLGLHIVRNIVEDILGGQIHVDSEAGAGTTMLLNLPRCAPELKQVDRA